LARTNVAAIISLLIVQIEQVHSCKKPRAITQLYEQHLDMLFFAIKQLWKRRNQINDVSASVKSGILNV